MISNCDIFAMKEPVLLHSQRATPDVARVQCLVSFLLSLSCMMQTLM